MRQANGVTLTSVLILLGSLAIVSAQQPASKRTVLQRGDLSAQGFQAVLVKEEIPAGATTGRHTHPGHEVGFVTEGTVTLEVNYTPEKVITAGEAFIVPADTSHSFTNRESGNVTILSAYVVEKGKPFSTKVP